MAIARSKVCMVRLHGGEIPPIAEDLLVIVCQATTWKGKMARDLLGEKGLREGVCMST